MTVKYCEQEKSAESVPISLLYLLVVDPRTSEVGPQLKQQESSPLHDTNLVSNSKALNLNLHPLPL